MGPSKKVGDPWKQAVDSRTGIHEMSFRQFVNKAPLLQYAEVQKVQGRRGTMFFRPVSLKDLSDSIPTGLLRPLLLLTLLSFLGLLFSFLGFVFPPLGFVFCCLCAFLGFLCHLLSFFSTAETLRFGHRHIPTREKLQTWGVVAKGVFPRSQPLGSSGNRGHPLRALLLLSLPWFLR